MQELLPENGVYYKKNRGVFSGNDENAPFYLPFEIVFGSRRQTIYTYIKEKKRIKEQ